MSSLYKALSHLFKHKKGLLTGVFFFIVFLCSNFLMPFLSKYIHIVDHLQDSSLMYNDRIANLENDMDVYLKQGVISRKSFNDYIARKDEEYHLQMAVNNDLYHRIGYLSGIHKAAGNG